MTINSYSLLFFIEKSTIFPEFFWPNIFVALSSRLIFGIYWLWPKVNYFCLSDVTILLKCVQVVRGIKSSAYLIVRT